MLFTLGASVVGHPFWTEGPDAAMQKMQFLKNLAIADGLFAMAFQVNRRTVLDLLAGAARDHGPSAAEV